MCGVVDYDYENYKIEPRFAADITEVIELVAPQNLEIFQVNDLVNLKWDMVNGADGYEVEYATSPDGEWNSATGSFDFISEPGKVIWVAVTDYNQRRFYRVKAAR